MTSAGSACPELPLPLAWAHRELAVAVAVVVDTNGSVDPTGVRVVESPHRPASDRQFYPRIYVVGARLKEHPERIGQAGYDSLVTGRVMSHVAGLRFHPALKDGRRVRSTVLIACQRSADD